MDEKYIFNLLHENGDILFSYPRREEAGGNLLGRVVERDRRFIKSIMDEKRFDMSVIAENKNGKTVIFVFSLFPSSGTLLGFECRMPYCDARVLVLSGAFRGIVCAEKADAKSENGDFSETVYSELGEIVGVALKPFRKMHECRSVNDALELADDIARVFGMEFDIDVHGRIGAMHLPRGIDIGLFTLFSVVVAGSVRTFKPRTHAVLRARLESGSLFFCAECSAESRRNLRREGATDEIASLDRLYKPLIDVVRKMGIPCDFYYEDDYRAEISPVREDVSLSGLKAPNLFTRSNEET